MQDAGTRQESLLTLMEPGPPLEPATRGTLIPLMAAFLLEVAAAALQPEVVTQREADDDRHRT